MSDPVKIAMRNTIKAVRSKVSASYRATSSHQICTRIRALEQYRKAKHIALYFAINSEIELDSLWKSAANKTKTVKKHSDK